MSALALTGAVARKALWRTVLTSTGGLRVYGSARLPTGPCVIVANHSSHADTAALIAALPAHRRPAVAAAADYWFGGGLRPWICRILCAGFPVRRSGGGSADLAAAARLLAAGRDVIVYPEGTRSLNGEVGDFHRGAALLAAEARVPLVPVGITGTRGLLPPGRTTARPKRTAVTVRIGVPVATSTNVTAEARARVAALITPPHEPAPRKPAAGDSAVRVRVARFATSWRALLLVAVWAFGEALSWPLLPELALAVLCVAAPKAGPRLAASAAIGSVAGGIAGYLLAAHGVRLPEPLTTARMHAAVAAQVAAHGAAAVRAQPLSGIPFKVYVAAIGAHRSGLAWFVAESAQARGARILAAGLAATLAGACTIRLRRFYPVYLLTLAAVFTGGLTAVIAAWS